MRDHMDPVLGRALEDVYRDRVAADATSAAGARSHASIRGTRFRTALVTVVVAVVVVLGAAVAIRAGQLRTAPAVTPTASPSESRLSDAALLQQLPKRPYGRIVHTWTDHDATTTTGPFTITGDTAVIAAVCIGGGAISITDASGSAHKESCTRLDIQQPFWRFDLGGDGRSTTATKPVHVGVKVLSGDPRFVVRLWAVDPRILDSSSWTIAATSATVPKTLRTCTAQDIDPKGSLASGYDPKKPLQSFLGVVSIRSRGSTDCAIRSWPSMRFRNSTGGQIGKAQAVDLNGRSTNSNVGSVNEYGEFPPARLRAGGHAYLEVQLISEARLQQDDAQQEAMPTPTSAPSNVPPAMPLCEPERVASIQLTIGRAPVTVLPPASPAVAGCRVADVSFGVTPVVVDRPGTK